MKKLVTILLIMTVLFSLSACGRSKKTGGETTELEGSLEEIMLAIYEGSNTEIDLEALGNIEITKENSEYYLGVDDIDYEKAIASEPVIMGGAAHSVCLIRMPEGSNIENAKTRIKENVNGFKWVCAGVPDEKIIVDNIGNTIVLIMDNDSEAYHEGFLALKK